MAATNSTVAAMPIKDLRPGINNLNLTFIVIEIGRPTTTKEYQVIEYVHVQVHSSE